MKKIRTKMLSVLVVLLASATILHAADPEGFGLWKGAAVKNSGNEGDGSAELHETQTGIMIVESGEATLVVGGTMVEPTTVKPHEVRGSSIEGGSIKQLSSGDIVHVPAKVPHQLKIASGRTFTYLVVKVDSN